jgi:hypothetical protein
MPVLQWIRSSETLETVKDDKLWKVYSVYIRLRDADKNGMIRCITSGRMVHWKDADAGHFISRRHMATKYDERNVNAQSRHDNRFASGEQFKHSKAIDQKWGSGTADKLLVKSRTTSKMGSFEINALTEHYKKEVERLKSEKGL